MELKASLAGARYVAGGTDLLVRMKNRLLEPAALISLRAIAELSGIDQQGTTTRIGAATPLADIAESPQIEQPFPVLAQAARSMASAQIRNLATIGGNLCNASPCADTAGPLIVLGARALIVSPSGKREVTVEQLFTGPSQTQLGSDEILTAILLDPLPPGARALFMKKSRVRMDLSLVNLAALLVMEETTCRQARLCTGAVAPIPLRLTQVESLIEGQKLTPQLIETAAEQAAQSVAPITDIRASEEYRRQIVRIYLSRALNTLATARAA